MLLYTFDLIKLLLFYTSYTKYLFKFKGLKKNVYYDLLLDHVLLMYHLDLFIELSSYTSYYIVVIYFYLLHLHNLHI